MYVCAYLFIYVCTYIHIDVYDECGECGGDGALEFYDCDGKCISDNDNDGYCDQNDN